MPFASSKRPLRNTKSFGRPDRTSAHQHKPTNSLPKHLRFKQSNARGLSAHCKAPPSARGKRQDHPSANGHSLARQHGHHTSLYSATSNNKLKSSPKVAYTTTIGPSPKRSRKWNNRRLNKVQRDQVRPQDCTDTNNQDFDILSNAELDLFILKVDAINADLDSIYGKDEPYPECRERNEDSCNRILLNNQRRVVSDICKHLRYYLTLQELQVKRAGQNHKDLYDYGRAHRI
jgi:hypothetical protein